MTELQNQGKRPPRKKNRFLLAGISCVLLLVLLLTGCFALGYNSSDELASSQLSIRLADAKKKAKGARVKQKQEKDKKTGADKKTKTAQATKNGKIVDNPASEGSVLPNPVKPPVTIPDVTNQPLIAGTKYNVLVDKSDHKLYVRNGSQVVRAWDCAVGKGGLGQKQRRGDNMTPVGTFQVDEIDDASGWTHDFGDGKGEIEGAYGPWFLSLDTEDLSEGNWDGIGIHGTHDPASLGTNASEGCIRLNNDKLRELEKIAYIGMPVTIQN